MLYSERRYPVVNQQLCFCVFCTTQVPVFPLLWLRGVGDVEIDVFPSGIEARSGVECEMGLDCIGMATCLDDVNSVPRESEEWERHANLCM